MNQSNNKKMIGLDLGSTAAKMVLFHDGKIKETKAIASYKYEDFVNQLPDDKFLFSTGYFRKNVEFDLSCTEITAAKYGVTHLLGEGHQIDVLIDIGGQDTKIINIATNDFYLNDKCSAGTGAFLEFMAKYFGSTVEELGEMHLKANGEKVQINSTCSVFAMSEVISYMVEKIPVQVVIAGIHYSFARRIAQLVPKNVNRIGLFGGTALNTGVVHALADVLNVKIGDGLVVIDPPQFVNGIGAILYGVKNYFK